MKTLFKHQKSTFKRIFKKHKFLLRSIAVSLVLALLFTSLPMDGIIALAEQAIEDSKLITVVEELEEYRTEFSKTYLKSDGTLEAVVSSNPIHFNEDGEWVEIDSTLETAENEKGTEILKNKKGSFNVELPAELQNSSEIAIEKGENKISIKLLETKKSKAKKNKDKKEKSEKLTKAQRKRMTAGELFEADNNQSSAVEYTSAYNDTNIRYDVTPNEVKESIVLQKAPNKKATYSYEITADGLTAILNEDNSIDFFEGSKMDGAEPVFSMPAPHMFDSNDEYSYDIATTLENKKGKYILTYKPSYEWLKSKDRAYPVTIDPTVTINSGIQDSYTFSGEGYGDSYTGYEQQLKVGTTAWLQPNDYWQTYLKFTDLPQIPYEDYRIDSAYLMLTPKATTGNWEEMELGVYELTEDWKNHQTGKVAERITFNNAPEDVGYSTATATVARGGADNGVGVGFEIAHIMEKWYENPEENFGIKLAAHLEDNQYNDNLVFHSSRSQTGTAPYLSLTYTEYVPVTGIEIIGKPENNKIFIDETLSLTITTTPENASDKEDIISNVVWSSDNPDIAEIDSVTGDVIAKTLGTTTISAVSGEYSTSFVLTVREHIPDEIYLMISDNYRLFEHEQYYLRADTFYQNSGVYAEVEYHSNNPEIVSISENGIITANSVGTAVITVSAKENPMVTATTTITVIPIQSAEIVNLPENNSLDVYKSHQLDLEITADNYSAIEGDPAFIGRYANFFEWNSSNPDVAIVDEYGTIYPYTTGTTVISVSRPNGGEVLDSFTLTVYYIEATDIEITNYPEDQKLVLGESQYLYVNVSPDNASQPFDIWNYLSWTSSNTDVITVDWYGMITAVGYGTANITVEYEGLTDSIEITVPDLRVPIDYVNIVLPIETMFVGTTEYVYYQLEPSNATDKRAVATSSDESVISVTVHQDENDPSVEPVIILTAHKLGSATINITFLSDPTKTLTETVDVISSDFGLTLPYENTIYTGQTWDLTSNPNARTDPRNDGIISVDGYGNITGVGPGRTSVEVWIGERSYFAHVEITVIQSYDLEINNIPTLLDDKGIKYNAINVGERYEGLGITITPTPPTNAEIVWSSSDESIAEVYYDYVRARVVLIGKGQGTVTIYAEITGDNIYGSASFELTVGNLKITKIELDPSDSLDDNILYFGEKASIKAKVYPLAYEQHYFDYIDWKTTNSEILFLSGRTNNKYVADVVDVSPGTVNVWAEIDDVSSAKFPIMVKAPDAKITNLPTNGIAGENTYILKDGTTHQLGIDLNPKNVAGTTYEWSSSNKNVATIDEATGKITTHAEGETVIFYRAMIGGSYSVTDVFTLRVVHIDSVFIDGVPSDNLTVGETYNLTAVVYPQYSYVQGVIWEVVEDDIASVDANGKLTLNAPGWVTIKAHSKIDYTVYYPLTLQVFSNVNITVKNVPSSNKLFKTGENYKINIDVSVDNSIDKSVYWDTSNANIATVSQSGLVSFHSPGYVEITVQSNANPLVIKPIKFNVMSYCGVNNYRDVTKHNMTLRSDGYYNCNICGYTVKSPELQDKDILSKEDYLKVVSLQLMYVHLEHLINESQLYSSYENEQIKITKLISTIRRQSIYDNLYQYSDSTHKCYGPETMEYTDFILYSSKCTNTIKLDGVLDLFQDLVLGYYAPEIVLINDITDILTFQMNPIEFSSFAADIYGLQNLSLALSIANEILDFSDNPLQEGDYCVRVSAGRVGYFYYSDSGQLKHIRIVPLSEATLPGL